MSKYKRAIESEVFYTNDELDYLLLEDERDKYKKALEQCLIVLSCMNDLSHIKRECKCIDVINEALI